MAEIYKLVLVQEEVRIGEAIEFGYRLIPEMVYDANFAYGTPVKAVKMPANSPSKDEGELHKFVNNFFGAVDELMSGLEELLGKEQFDLMFS